MPSKKLTMTVRMLEKTRKVYARLPKYITTAFAGGSSFCIGGATQYENVKRELARIQDAFGTMIDKFDPNAVRITVSESKNGKICQEFTLKQLMGVRL